MEHQHLISNTPKIPLLGDVWGSNLTTLPLNCKIIERLVPIDHIFKNRGLPTTPHKQSRGSLGRHFALVRTIQDEKNSPNLQSC